MQEAFEVILFAVVVLAALIGIAGFASRSRAYDEIGRGGLSLDRTPPPPATAAVRDAEIRQMLDAANERRARRGQAPLDVSAELARLTAPAADPALEAEVRALVAARNERRARRGQPPLDVEAEVRRTLSDRT
ncbi:MAG: hypothetical protein IRZ32_16500 [Solirubrobacteraceae bacterium]|nr:hypothetical protein [Solirubrobacteraceae bacterium]